MRNPHIFKITLLCVLAVIAFIVIAVNQNLDQQMTYWGSQPVSTNLWLSPENNNVISVESYRDFVGKVISIQPIEQQEITIGYTLKLWIPETSEEIGVNLGTKLSEPVYIFRAGEAAPEPLSFQEFIGTLNAGTNIAATLLTDLYTNNVRGLRNIIIQPSTDAESN